MSKKNHGKRNVIGWTRMSQRQRLALANKTLREQVEELRAELQMTQRVVNHVIAELRATRAYFMEVGHQHPDSRLILAGANATRPIAVTQERFDEWLKQVAEELLRDLNAREAAAQTPPAEPPPAETVTADEPPPAPVAIGE